MESSKPPGPAAQAAPWGMPSHICLAVFLMPALVEEAEPARNFAGHMPAIGDGLHIQNIELWLNGRAPPTHPPPGGWLGMSETGPVSDDSPPTNPSAAGWLAGGARRHPDPLVTWEAPPPRPLVSSALRRRAPQKRKIDFLLPPCPHVLRNFTVFETLIFCLRNLDDPGSDFSIHLFLIQCDLFHVCRRPIFREPLTGPLYLVRFG